MLVIAVSQNGWNWLVLMLYTSLTTGNPFFISFPYKLQSIIGKLPVVSVRDTWTITYFREIRAHPATAGRAPAIGSDEDRHEAAFKPSSRSVGLHVPSSSSSVICVLRVEESLRTVHTKLVQVYTCIYLYKNVYLSMFVFKNFLPDYLLRKLVFLTGNTFEELKLPI
jgi:hypothetical protein